jgi:hypothetical protein
MLSDGAHVVRCLFCKFARQDVTHQAADRGSEGGIMDKGTGIAV